MEITLKIESKIFPMWDVSCYIAKFTLFIEWPLYHWCIYGNYFYSKISFPTHLRYGKEKIAGSCMTSSNKARKIHWVYNWTCWSWPRDWQVIWSNNGFPVRGLIKLQLLYNILKWQPLTWQIALSYHQSPSKLQTLSAWRPLLYFIMLVEKGSARGMKTE